MLRTTHTQTGLIRRQSVFSFHSPSCMEISFLFSLQCIPIQAIFIVDLPTCLFVYIGTGSMATETAPRMIHLDVTLLF